jgi:hypothetical protein
MHINLEKCRKRPTHIEIVKQSKINKSNQNIVYM